MNSDFLSSVLPCNTEEFKRGTTLLDIESFGTPSQPKDLGWASMDEESVLAYLGAVGDELPIYAEIGLAPPICGVALALGQILQQTRLPPGAIHSLQEFDTLNPIELGSKLRTSACLERQRERGGLRFLTFGVSMEDQKHQAALGIKTTLLVPETQDGEGPKRQTEPGGDGVKLAMGDLAPVSRSISQCQLAKYSEVSGDHNPLHLNAEFAAGTQFGGVIAHGMLTLAFISEMMAASVGHAWLASGSVRARFKGAAYPGDPLETWGKTSKSDDSSEAYSIGLKNSTTGEDLITGTATVRKN